MYKLGVTAHVLWWKVYTCLVGKSTHVLWESLHVSDMEGVGDEKS